MASGASDEGSLASALQATPDTEFLLLAVIILPTFLLVVLYLIAAWRTANAQWESNKKRRRQRKASSNVRLSFDAKGTIIKECLVQCQDFEKFEHVVDMLHQLGQWHQLLWGKPALKSCYQQLQKTKKAVDDNFDTVQQFLSRKSSDATQKSMLQTINETDTLLTAISKGQTPDKSIETLEKLEKDVNKVVADKAKWEKSGPRVGQIQHLEPPEFVDGVKVRREGFLRFFAEFRDKYDIGSRRLLLALVALWIAFGPVRFMGILPMMLFCIILTIELGVELLRVKESRDFKQVQQRCTVAMFARIAAPMLFGYAINFLFYMFGGFNRPSSNQELQDKGTFLEPPPHYDLEFFKLQTWFVPIIFGVMHSTLLTLWLIPLPLCYRLQAILAKRFPRIRGLVPQNPVWLHRTLGLTMLVGLTFGGAIWVIFQGYECYSPLVGDDFRACEAFAPPPGIGLDVFVLRFFFVWPLVFPMMPLMIFPMYPEEKAGGPEDVTVLEACGCPFAWVFGFAWRRLVDISMLIVPFAGCLLTLTVETIVFETSVYLPFWFLIFPLVLLHTIIKARGFLLRRCGTRCARFLGHAEEAPEFLHRIWWEMAYAAHVAAAVVVISAALFIRLEIFFTALPTWTVYLIDRGLLIRDSIKNKAPIHVGEGRSSHVISKEGSGGKEPTHVRLVLKKPPGFDYKAGQWVHLAFHRCGSYFQMPPWFTPLLHWHAFSLASCEQDDFLEFHIAVKASRNVMGAATGITSEGTEILAKKYDDESVKLKRKDHWLDWCYPHLVPVLDAATPTTESRMGDPYKATQVAQYLRLENPKSSTAFKAMRPQLQWTGKLWNIVWWLEERRSKKQAATEQRVHIMGPYGTMPYTCMAHNSVMLVGAGVGFPSMGGMLRSILKENKGKPADQAKKVCFIWTATKVEQLHLCFPCLLADLADYVGNRPNGLKELQAWLTVKIFISSFDATSALTINPGKELCSLDAATQSGLTQVRKWLLGQDGRTATKGVDEDGTYIASGSLGASFAGILRGSVFIRDHVVTPRQSLGICFCGPPELCSWLRNEVASTLIPVKVEFASECAA